MFDTLMQVLVARSSVAARPLALRDDPVGPASGAGGVRLSAARTTS